jgi:regulatory protein
LKTNQRFTVEIDQKKVSLKPSKIDSYADYEEARKAAIEEGMKVCDRALKRRFQSRREMEEKLYKKGFIRSEVEFIINELIRMNLIDDRRFTRFFLESHQKSRPFGEYALRQKLMAKGISREIMDEEIAGYFEENDPSLEALELVKRRFDRYENLDKMEKIKKIDTYLFGRGFQSDVIQKVFRLLKEEDLLED